MTARSKLSDEVEAWLKSPGDKTLGSLAELFGQRSFALLFVLLLGVPALPVPTGGASHVFEVIAILLSTPLRPAARRSGCPDPRAGRSDPATLHRGTVWR
jgi:hypothetical protein